MMIKRLTLLFTVFLSLLAPAQDESQQHQAWRKSLGSPEFGVREKATFEIWEKGKEGLNFLEKLIDGEDPELAARATAIIRKVKLGVTPETPAEIAKLIDRYFGSTTLKKISAIEKLLAAEEYDILIRLRKLEDNPDVLIRVDAIISRILPKIVRDYLNEDKVDLAMEYLLLSQQFSHLIHYAHLLDQTGGLDAEIRRLANSEDPEEEARYLACLRVKGDPAPLRRAAIRLGSNDANTLAALVMGDHVPYLESLLENSNPTLANRHYVNWTLANHRGDSAAQKEAYDALVYLSDEKTERNAARMGLFRMGYGEVVFKSLKPTELTGKVDYRLAHEDYVQAQELLGLPDGKEESFSVWLKETTSKGREDIGNTGNSLELDRLVSAANFLEGRGETEKATRCVLDLFGLVRESSELDPASIAGRTFNSAPVSTITAIAHEIDEYEASLEDFFGLMRIYGDKCIWLDNILQELNEGMGTRERLLLTLSFSARRLLVDPAEYTRARDQVFEHIMKNEDEWVGSLSNLYILLYSRNREKDLLKFTAALEKAGSPNHYLEAIVAIDGGRIRDGAEAFQKIEFKEESASAEFLYQRGLILKKVGISGGDELMEKGLLLSNGGSESLRQFAEHHLQFGDTAKAYQFLSKALLRTENPTRSSQYGVREGLIDELGSISVVLGKWQETLAYREVIALDAIYRSVSSGVYAMRSRFQILVARGAVAMQKGDIVGAVAAFSRAHQILPRDGYLANELFPLLREVGLSELHNQLFAETARHCRKNIELYPKDDNVYNNFAWLASRANRQLDEAEAYLKTALEMNPHSAAYLDTMGEIYFARQNRPEALRWSTLSIKNDVLGNSGNRWELQEQHRRFKSGGFPVR
ncbi:MAG: tetratricopeptide (TPR) repeat protein [Akkermansiaceae bacterium]|jgi:tetratricopeptide (TPR) repeat protein